MKKLVLSVLSCSLSASCAVGYGVGTTSHSASASSDKDSILTGDKEMKFSATYQEFRIIDTTGILLAGFVNAGRQYNARQEAIDAAQYRTPDANGMVKVEYSWEPMPILAGLLTDLRIRVPLGSPSAEVPTGADARKDSTEYWAFDLRPEFYTFRPAKTLPMVASLWLNVAVEDWKTKTADGIEDPNLTEIDMGFGTSVSYVIRDNVTATGRVGIGVLSPLFGLLDGGSKFNPTGEVEIGYRPLSTEKFGLQVGAVAAVGRAHATERSAVYNRLGLNVAVTFGDQNKKRGKTAETPSAPAETEHLDPNGSPSGNVCIGKRVPESCKVVDDLPQGEKLVYVLCAQATKDAADKGDFSTQPTVCRQAAGALYKSAKGGSWSPEQRRRIYIAAATAFDFAGAGFELTSGKLGADQCAMVEGVFASVVGEDKNNVALPAKLVWADEAVQQCRSKNYACHPDDTLGVVCTTP